MVAANGGKGGERKCAPEERKQGQEVRMVHAEVGINV